MKVQWPSKAVDADGDDLSEPVQQFLLDLRLLEDKTDNANLFRTPASLQVITAGATSLGKVWPAIVAAIGGGSALVTGLMGFGVGEEAATTTANIIQRAVFTGSASLLASAVAIAIAIMVRADVNARSTASAAQFEARAAVTAAILSSSEYGRPVSAPPQPNYMLRTNNDEWLPVLAFTMTANGLAADVGNNRVILAQNFKALVPTNSWQ